METVRELTGSARCRKRRGYHVSVRHAETPAMQVSAYARNAAKDVALTGMAPAAKDTDEFFAGLAAPEAQKEFMKNELLSSVGRYARAEKRAGQKAPGKAVEIFGEDVYVHPDAVFAGTAQISPGVYRRYVEAVAFRYRKTDVTKGGRKPDAGVNTNPELYCLMQYAKELADPLPGEEMDVKGSFYFLKAQDESVPFFASVKGVRPSAVSLSETLIGGKDAVSDADRTYSSVFASVRRGEEPTADMCAFCELRSFCAYTGPQERLDDDAPAPAKTVDDSALTPSQKDAIAFDAGTARINAGAGSGKTTVVAARAARLLRKGESVLLITFTDAGAAEFDARVKSLVGDDGPEGFTATTFNAFGDAVVQENHSLLGFTAPPRLIDEVERTSRIAALLRREMVGGLDYEHFDCTLPTCRGALPVAARAFALFGRMNDMEDLSEDDTLLVRKGLGKDGAFVTGRDSLGELFKLFREYRAGLKEGNLIEYDDQVSGAIAVFEADPSSVPAFGHVIVDEFQDTSPEQFEMLRHLAEKAGSLVVVGDDSQAIYGFRGTSPEFIIGFPDLVDGDVEDMYLLENHRSTPEIVEFANRVNALNRNRVKKDMVATRPSGREVRVLPVEKPGDVVPTAAALIERELGNGAAPEDVAYIAYTRAELLRMKKELESRGVASVLMCPEPALENPRIASALAFAALVRDPDVTQNAVDYLASAWKGDPGSDSDLERGIREVQAGAERIREDHDAGEFEEFLMELDADGDEIYEGFLEALSKRAGLDAKISYCAEYAEFGQNEAYKKAGRYDGVVLVTAHSAKGLEYPIVVNDVSRYDTTELSPADVEERRRLLFVSATRARDALVVTGRQFLKGDGESDDTVENRFLAEAAEAL